VNQIVVAAQMLLAEWLSVQNVQQNNRETVSRNDTASGTAAHSMICNVNASFLTRYNRTGYSACIRDEGGILVKAMAGWFIPVLQIHEGEGVAMLKSMKWVHQMSISSMTFLSDSQVLVAAIYGKNEGQSASS